VASCGGRGEPCCVDPTNACAGGLACPGTGLCPF
jgi:hypothetical protein